MKKRALISVSDKTGVVKLASELVGLGYEIISTGGTQKELEKNGIPVINISEITGFPECLDGRVKTLHPYVHAGLLAKRNLKDHMDQLEKLNINTIDVVAVNLYPFKQTIQKLNVTLEEAIENIDIGGPTMLRSAAKNAQDVLVLCDPTDYDEAIQRLKDKTDDCEYRMKLMYKVFRHTAVYDTYISNYLADILNIQYPDQITLAFEKVQGMRYGENPHQTAAFYKDAQDIPSALTNAVQLHGKELSFNNINDADGAIALLRELGDDQPAIVAVKHTNPCGAAIRPTISEAFRAAYESDPVSIFGGIVASNREIDYDTAVQMSNIFLEIVIAPSFSKEALEVLTKKKNLRLLRLPDVAKPCPTVKDMKKVLGGLLIQDIDNQLLVEEDLQVVTKVAPTKEQLEELKFAWKIVKHCKSNAIAITANKTTLGCGIGQVNRIWAVKQAIEHSGGYEKTKGAVLASDAFFPFPDSVEEAHKAGIAAIIQPGGSAKDQESIDACDRYGIAMVFTKMRHFKH
ncbi:MAG TPA: bifunctional phosphoribosylaminoimidazolecarboxamide formyltransferase/IMP cyclohydrolase [Clostridia bacterium]